MIPRLRVAACRPGLSTFQFSGCPWAAARPLSSSSFPQGLPTGQAQWPNSEATRGSAPAGNNGSRGFGTGGRVKGDAPGVGASSGRGRGKGAGPGSVAGNFGGNFGTGRPPSNLGRGRGIGQPVQGSTGPQRQAEDGALAPNRGPSTGRTPPSAALPASLMQARGRVGMSGGQQGATGGPMPGNKHSNQRQPRPPTWPTPGAPQRSQQASSSPSPPRRQWPSAAQPPQQWGDLSSNPAAATNPFGRPGGKTDKPWRKAMRSDDAAFADDDEEGPSALGRTGYRGARDHKPREQRSDGPQAKRRSREDEAKAQKEEQDARAARAAAQVTLGDPCCRTQNRIGQHHDGKHPTATSLTHRPTLLCPRFVAAACSCLACYVV